MATRPGTDNGACEAFGRRLYLFFAAALGAVAGMADALTAAVPARAQECPGNPDVLGTSRVLVLEPGALTRVGLMQYPQTLPLADKEVVLTFDDGPLPRYSNQVLDILAAQCVQATYFLVGQMARTYPAWCGGSTRPATASARTARTIRQAFKSCD